MMVGSNYFGGFNNDLVDPYLDGNRDGLVHVQEKHVHGYSYVREKGMIMPKGTVDIDFEAVGKGDGYGGSHGGYTSGDKLKSLPGGNFVCVLLSDFKMMDAQWLSTCVSYLQFNEVLQPTIKQLERELSLEDLHGMMEYKRRRVLKAS